MPKDCQYLPLSDIRQNHLTSDDLSVHDWFRFILSFPPHLIREHFALFDVGPGSVVLDPFCGTGTTVVEAKKMGIKAFGQEAHPMAHFASQVKTNWNIKTASIARETELVQKRYENLVTGAQRSFSLEEENVLVEGSISCRPLHQVLSLREAIVKVRDTGVRNLFKLLLARSAVLEASNLSFCPEVSVRKKKDDADVWSDWLSRVNAASGDIETFADKANTQTTVLNADSRSSAKLNNGSVDFVFTSPPYPNEKDYTRTTRLESVLLGFITNRKELRAVKNSLLRSNTRNIYKNDADDAFVSNNSNIGDLAREIERRRESVGKNSGFEKLYATVIKMYFGGMKRHFVELKPKLKPDARLCYVVGDQASFLQVHIKTGELLAEIAHDAGYQIAGIEMFRTRFSTTTKRDLREEVLILRNKLPSVTVRVPDWKKDKAPQQEAKTQPSRYDQLILSVFEQGLSSGKDKSTFTRADMETAAKTLDMPLPKNLGDVLYTYRYRADLPQEIRERAPEGEEWVIRSIGRGSYKFELATMSRFYANPMLTNETIIDKTPIAIRNFAFSDQQLLLAIVRINRLIERFTGINCELLGSHFRSTIKGTGQVTTDEIYVGGDETAVFCFPVQARGKQEELSVVQIEQDLKMCADRFPNTICRAIGVQLLGKNIVALLEFVTQDNQVRLKNEKHYKLLASSSSKIEGKTESSAPRRRK